MFRLRTKSLCPTSVINRLPEVRITRYLTLTPRTGRRVDVVVATSDKRIQVVISLTAHLSLVWRKQKIQVEENQE